jgi:hypothetical protein
MKWFTREWATGQLSDEEWERVPGLYAAHLESIASHFHDGANELALSLNLHDAHVKQWQIRKSTIDIEAVAGDLQSGYRRVRLLFENAALQLPASLEELRFDDPRTELLYDEVDVVGDDVFEYRALVWPAGELAIQFGAVAITTAPAQASDR